MINYFFFYNNILQKGFASQNVHDELCSRSSKVLTCPDDYIAIFHSEFLVETNGKGCNHE